VTIEATLAQHKKARRRRLSRRHSSFSLLLLLHHSPSADESRKEPLTANLDADQIALPQSVIVAIFVREQALRSIQIHRLQINGCSLLRSSVSQKMAIIQNPIVHLEPVYSVLVECLGATSAKHKHDEGD
jgi:hypothetical protein